MFSHIVDLLLMEWIWSVTHGIYHIPINIMIMFILTKITVKYESIPLFLLIILSQLFAFAGLSALVFGLIAIGSAGSYIPTEQGYELSYMLLPACIGLGLIYTFFQILFFYFSSKRYHIDVIHMAWIIFLSNIISAQIVYMIFPFKN